MLLHNNHYRFHLVPNQGPRRPCLIGIASQHHPVSNASHLHWRQSELPVIFLAWPRQGLKNKSARAIIPISASAKLISYEISYMLFMVICQLPIMKENKNKQLFFLLSLCKNNDVFFAASIYFSLKFFLLRSKCLIGRSDNEMFFLGPLSIFICNQIQPCLIKL